MQKQVMKPALTVGVVAFGLFAALSAEAQEARRSARPAKEIRLGEMRVEGRIQKPQAFYILQRSNLNFEGLELKNSFVPKIIKSVEKGPF
jgi:hypothetical protein